MLVNLLRTWWTGLRPTSFTSHCSLTSWAGEVSCLHLGIVPCCEQANMVAEMESWPEEDIGGSCTCGWQTQMGPTNRWLLLANRLHQVFLFFKPWDMWCYVRLPAFHLRSIFVHMYVLLFGCWCCPIVLFYVLREMLTFLCVPWMYLINGEKTMPNECSYLRVCWLLSQDNGRGAVFYFREPCF